MKAMGILIANSVDFATQVLQFQSEGIPVVAMKTLRQELPGVSIERIFTPKHAGGWLEGRGLALNAGLEPSFITFTSGSEGDAKAIVISQRNIAETVRRIVSALSITGGIREYAGAPVTHSFGIYRVRAIASVGGSLYIPHRGLDPREFARMLRAGEVNALSCVPSLLRVILSCPEVIGTAGTKLQWLEIGAQPLSGREKAKTRALFPNAGIVYSYGLTEAPRTALLDLSNERADLDCAVGRPVDGSEVDISQDGRVRIRGPHVSAFYVGPEGLSRLTNHENWLETNDFGYLQEGQLFIEGRADELINSGGVKIRPEALEEMIRTKSGASLTRIAVVRIPDQLRGDGFLIAIDEPGVDEATVRGIAAGALRQMGVAAPVSVWLRSTLPYTNSGKVIRRMLREEFLRTRGQPSPSQ